MGRPRFGRSEEDAGPPPAQQTNLPWGMENTEMQPSSLTSLTDDKLARFALGHQKKTKYQKEREDREAKKRQADEEAAKIYATFVASFDNEDEQKGKSFIRSGATAVQGNSTRASGVAYRLNREKNNENDSLSVWGTKVSEMDKMLHEIKQKEAEQPKRNEGIQSVNRSKKRRAIDDFLDEIKDRGPVPVSMEGSGMAKGSFDNGDPETTNLYVGNLAPTITEEVLKTEFGRYGEVYSVKIMWPRSEEERARRRNCGFVSFYERRDADDARINLDNKQLDGQPMIVGWGKSVKIPPRASSLGSSKVLERPTVPLTYTTSNGSLLRANVAEFPALRIEMPTDPEVKWRVDRLARYVATDGLQFENTLRMREATNRAYSFLFEPQSAVGLYYRWRVYSFTMGDDEHTWRTEPFQMTLNGPVWYPPTFQSSKSSKRGSPARSAGRFRRQSTSQSRGSSTSLERSSRQGQRKRRYRSRSSSESSEDDGKFKSSRQRRHQCRKRSRSRSRQSRRRQSRSWSSEAPKPRNRSRSRSRITHQRHESNNCKRSQERQRSDAQGGHQQEHVEKAKQLLTGQQIARARDMERGRERSQLSSQDYDTFKDLLATLTLEREAVKKTMGFALDKSEAAVDLVHIIYKAFCASTSSSVTLVGLLYVTSDILHNSSAAVKNASLFRTTFQACLPEIMDLLRMAHKTIAGRMSANAMKEKVTTVLTAWEHWSLFPPAVLVGLHATFLRRTEESEFIATRSLNVSCFADTDVDRLRKTCRQSGIVASGGVQELVARLQWLKEFTTPTAQVAVRTSLGTQEPSDPFKTTKGVFPTVVKADLSSVESGEVNRLSKTEVDAGWEKKLVDEELDGEPIDGEMSEHKVGSDNERSRESLDGEPLDESDLPASACDGEALDNDELDGALIDEDELDGEPM